MFASKAKRFGIAALFLVELFRNIGKFGAKKQFTDRRHANTIQLFVSIKGNFSGLFLNMSQRRAIPQVNSPVTTW